MAVFSPNLWVNLAPEARRVVDSASIWHVDSLLINSCNAIHHSLSQAYFISRCLLLLIIGGVTPRPVGLYYLRGHLCHHIARLPSWKRVYLFVTVKDPASGDNLRNLSQSIFADRPRARKNPPRLLFDMHGQATHC